MHNTVRNLAGDDGPVDAALAEYFTCLDRGDPVDLGELVAAHPGCEPGLRRFLHHEQKLHALATRPFGPQNQAGQIIGDFRLIGELGRGGMGVVYEAEQLSLGRRVALKILPFAATFNKQQLARFKNEARAAATLDHPHIVAVHSVGSEGDVHYYAMQLIGGRSLAQVIDALRGATHSDSSPGREAFANKSTDDHDLSTVLSETDPLPRSEELDPPRTSGEAGGGLPLPAFGSRDYFRTLARLGREAATALDHAHQSGVLHRDIKPANLLLDESGKLWIADFGLARMETDASLTMTGDMLGTLRYMAPEQALAQRAVVDHRSDIYSLGATLYELLTLEPAFDETDRAQLLQQIARDEPPAPRKLDARIPQDLETIVLKAMRKSPEERYATAQALADDLQNFVDDKPIAGKPPTRRERLVKWSRRHPAVVLSTAAVLIAVTIAAAASAVVVAQVYRRETVQRSLAEKERNRAEIASKHSGINFQKALDAIESILVEAALGAGPWTQLHPELRTLFSKRVESFYKDLLQNESLDSSLRFETAVGYASLASLHTTRKEFQRAEECLRDSLQILDRLCVEHPGNVYHLDKRAWHNVLLAEALIRREQIDEAEAALETANRLFKQLIRDDPTSHTQFNALRISYQHVERIQRLRGDESWRWGDKVLPFLQEVVRRAPENLTIHENISLALWHIGLKDEAINACREMVRCLPNDAYAHFWTGRLLDEKGLKDEAINAFRDAVRLAPGAPLYHHMLAAKLLEKGSLDEALVQMKIALDLEPTIHGLSYNYALLLAATGRMDEAVAAFRMSMRIHPEPLNLEARCAIADILSLQDDTMEQASRMFRQAIEGYREWIDENPDDVDSLASLAAILADCTDVKLREPAEALKLAEKAVELAPNAGHCWVQLGAARYRTGNFEDALEALLKGRELGEDGAATTFYLALIEWQLGNFESARDWYAKGVARMTKSPTGSQVGSQRIEIVGGGLVLLRAETEQLLDTAETGP